MGSKLKIQKGFEPLYSASCWEIPEVKLWLWIQLIICFVSGFFLFVSFCFFFPKTRKLISHCICFGLNWLLFDHCSFCCCLKSLVVCKGLYDMANLMTNNNMSFYIQRSHTLKAPALKVQILSAPIFILDKAFLCVSFVSSKIVMCFTRHLQSIFLHIYKTWM